MKVLKCNAHVLSTRLGKLDTDDVPDKDLVIEAGLYTFVYDYPLKDKAVFDHYLPRTLDPLQLLQTAAEDYEKIYERADDGNPYGIWGHGLGDLYFEGVTIHEDTKRVRFIMGS